MSEHESAPETEAAQAESAQAGANPAEGAAHAGRPHKRKARIEHRTPGRIRMKVHAAKDDPEMLEAYREIFTAVPGVNMVIANPQTGSIVIHYDLEHHHPFEDRLHHHAGEHIHTDHAAPPEDEVSEMARRIEAEAEFLAQRSQLARGAVDFFKGFDRELKVATDNTIDLKIILAGGLAAFTFLEIGAEAATPMWVTLALFSLNHFAELHDNHPRPPAAAAPASA